MSFLRIQIAEGRTQTGRSMPPAACRPLPTSAHGFTLVEMLVVMGVIVLALAMAVGAFKSLSGSNSEQTAQNTVSAYLASVRSDAIGMQQPRGAMFLLDELNDRAMMVEVMQSPPQPTDRTGVMFLDLMTDRDPLPLPTGMRAWTILDTYHPPTQTLPNGSTVTTAAPFTNYRYLGFNTNYTVGMTNPDKALLGGVILFDGQGNVLCTRYGFRFSITSGGVTVPTALLTALYITPPASPPAYWPVFSSVADPYIRSQVGFVLVDKKAFQSQQPAAQANKDGNTAGSETVLDPWLDVNTTPILVNRYNGTLSRAE